MILFYTRPLLILAAVLPAVILLLKVEKADRLEKESRGLLLSLIFLGVVSTAIAMLAEKIGISYLDSRFPEGSVIYNILLYFVVVGLSEEFSKYVLLKKRTWRNPEFNCKFDAVVYSVFVSLGFALWENIGYVAMYGFGTAIVRAITAVPGHACFGVFMGCFYGMAKYHETNGNTGEAKRCLRMSLFIPAGIHGLYDYIATVDTGFGGLFTIFVAILFFVSLRLVKRLSAKDSYIFRNDIYF